MTTEEAAKGMHPGILNMPLPEAGLMSFKVYHQPSAEIDPQEPLADVLGQLKRKRSNALEMADTYRQGADAWSRRIWELDRMIRTYEEAL